MSKLLKKINWPKLLYFVFILVSIGAMTIMPASAADIWDKAKEIMQDVYDEVVLISTVAAVVTASIAKSCFTYIFVGVRSSSPIVLPSSSL